MTQEIKFIILLILLFYGSYATQVAKRDLEPHKLTQIRMKQLKKDLTERDYAFMNLILKDKSYHGNGQISSSESVIVKDGKIIARGSGLLEDLTAHAEMQAVTDARRHLGTPLLDGCVLYSSTQPCPMCLSLLYLMKVDKIIYFMASDPGDLPPGHLMNQEVYRALILDPSDRLIPEVVLFPEDLN